MISRKGAHNTKQNEKNKFHRRKFYFSSIDKYLTRNKKRNYGEQKIETETKDNIYKYGTWSDRIGVAVNIVMTIVTLSLFNQAVKQNSISEKNIALANSIYSLAKTQFDSSISSGIQASEHANKMLDIQYKSVETQIKSIKENQKEFELENRPVLMISNIHFGITNPVKISFDIRNYGKQAARLLSVKGKTIWSTKANYNNFDTLGIGSLQETYLPGGSYIKQEGEYEQNIFTSQEIENIKSGKLFIYLIGEIKYYNQITMKRRIYRYNCKISYYPRYNFELYTEADFPTK